MQKSTTGLPGRPAVHLAGVRLAPVPEPAGAAPAHRHSPRWRELSSGGARSIDDALGGDEARLPPVPGRTRRYRPRASTRGHVLFELLGSYGVYVAMLVAAVSLIGMVWASAGTTDAFQEFTALNSTIRSGYAGAYGAGDMVPTVIRYAPPRLIDSANNRLINTFKGTLTLQGNGPTYIETWAGVPSSDCQRMAAQSADGASQGGAVAVSINGQAQTLPLQPAQAGVVCSLPGSGPNGGNTIQWTLG